MVTWGLAGAFAAAFAYGIATILQAAGARAQGDPSGLDARLLVRLAHSTPYVLGVALDGLGFALSFIALRSEPLFLVQAIVASSLAVTAVLAVLVMDARPAVAEWLALFAVTAGLICLGLAATRERPRPLQETDRLLLLSVVVAVGVAAYVVARRRPDRPGGAWVFGALAGLMYGAGGVAARILTPSRRPLTLLSDPALWTLVAAGCLGLLLYALALQRGQVTTVTAATTAADTLMPAAIGVFVLGDRPAPGHGGVAVAGFLLTVTGALALARFGEAPADGTAGGDSPVPAGEAARLEDARPAGDSR